MNCFNCTTPCEYDNGLGYCVKENLAEIVKKHAEPPVSREKFEHRKKVWRAHEKDVLESFLSAAKDLVDAVERYVKQECLRSELLNKKNALKSILK